MSWWSRARNVFQSDKLIDDLDEEVRFHLESRIRDLIEDGLTPEAAAREAARRFGSTLRVREASRDVKLLSWLDSIVRDVRLGARMLRRNRLVVGAAVLSLALALGACVAAFSLVDALILRPLPVPSARALIALSFPTFTTERTESETFNDPAFVRLRDAARGHADLFAMSTQVVNPAVFESGGVKERVRTQYVSGDAFDRLGVRAHIGRLIAPADDAVSAAPVSVISHAFWRARFGGDAAVVGRWFAYNGRQVQIVGVTEARWTGIDPSRPTDVWFPYGFYNPRAFGSPAFNWFHILGRVHDGTATSQVQAILQAAFTGFRQDFASAIGPSAPAEMARFLSAPLFVRSAATGLSPLRRQFERPLWILAAIAGLVLLIAGSNLGNLYLARASSREREMAVRLSIGAGRGRLIQQLLLESAIVAALACALGLVVAALAGPTVVAMLTSADDPVRLDLPLNGPVLAFAAALTALTTMLFGLVPAWQASRTAPLAAIGGANRTSRRTRDLLPFVALQVAFGVMVLFVGGLLVLSFVKLSRVDPGYSQINLLLVDVEPTRDASDVERRAAILAAVARLRETPGVRSAAAAEFGTLGRPWTRELRSTIDQTDVIETTMSPVTDGYFETLGVSLITGRTFTARDMSPPGTGVVVNQAFARRYFGSDAAAGGVLRGRFSETDDRSAEHQIVGVVTDTRYDMREPAAPIVYFPLRRSGTIHVRVAGGTANLAPVLREVVGSAAPLLRVTSVTSQQAAIDRTLIRERLLAGLALFFAAVGLVLVGVGLYGVLSYAVQQRTREIGIRLALGARRITVVRRVLADTARAAIGGAAMGLAGGFYLSRFVETLLFGITPWNVTGVAWPLATFLAAAALSAALPAWRATQVDPAVALRRE